MGKECFTLQQSGIKIFRIVIAFLSLLLGLWKFYWNKPLCFYFISYKQTNLDYTVFENIVVYSTVV
jgi:hypothetical protein